MGGPGPVLPSLHNLGPADLSQREVHIDGLVPKAKEASSDPDKQRRPEVVQMTRHVAQEDSQCMCG